jgi:predicted Zn-dependent protease
MQNQDQKKQEMILTAYGVVSEYGVILPYSRKHELEADHIGVLLMAKAGYDPSEAPTFWERFSGNKQGAAPMEWMSTHPADATRAAALRELMPQAMKDYEGASVKYGLGDPVP